MNRYHALVALSLVLLHAAPAAALQDSNCFPRDEAPGEHGFGTFFDSAVVAGVIEREWNPEWGTLLASLAPDSADAAGRLRLYSTSSETGGVERIAEWLLALRNSTPTPDSTFVAMMLAEGEEVRPRSITRFAQCTPRMLDREAIGKKLADAVRLPALQNSPELPSGRPAQVVVWAYVGTHGRVFEYRIHESSGFSDWDQIAGRVALDIEFEPASHEGVPVPVWVEIPFTLNRNSRGRIIPSMGRGGNPGSGGGDAESAPGGTLPR